MSDLIEFEQSKIDMYTDIILKPHREGFENLSKEEIEQYLNLDIEKMKKLGINIKLIVICKETQKFIKNNKEILLKNIINKEEEENER